MPFEAHFEFCVAKDTLDQYSPGKSVRSSTQVVGFLPCGLLVFPKGTSSSASSPAGSQVSVFLEARPLDVWPVDWEFKDVQLQICLLNHDVKDFNIKKMETHTFSAEQKYCGWHDFITCATLCLGFLSPNAEGLSFHTVVKGDSLGIEPTCRPVPADCLRHFPERLWEDTSFADVVVATAGGQEFQCHRVVLGCASAVFKRMLQGPFQEGRSSRIVISEVEAGELRAMLEYIYKGVVAKDANGSTMIRLADMYELPGLAVKYGRLLVDNITAQSVRSTMLALRKRGRSEALDECYKIARQKVQKDDTLFDAMIDDS